VRIVTDTTPVPLESGVTPDCSHLVPVLVRSDACPSTHDTFRAGRRSGASCWPHARRCVALAHLARQVTGIMIQRDTKMRRPQASMSGNFCWCSLVHVLRHAENDFAWRMPWNVSLNFHHDNKGARAAGAGGAFRRQVRNRVHFLSIDGCTARRMEKALSWR